MNQTSSKWPAANEKLSDFLAADKRDKVESFLGKVTTDPVALKAMLEKTDEGRRTVSYH